ncbi:hypothetical protein Q5752_004518 [Cryptotrichosporon argae]
MAHYLPSSDYPPSSPTYARPPPPLRVNTRAPAPAPSYARSTHSHAHAAYSPVRKDARQGPLYDLPTTKGAGAPAQTQAQARAVPGGLAAIAAEAQRARPPSRPHSTGRTSIETAPTAPSLRRDSGSATRRPPTVRSPPPGGAGSVYSGREGSVYGRRVEGVTSPTPADLQLFAHHCRLFYFSPTPPESSASFIASTLAALPPSHRAAYTRLQSSLRSLAHLHHLRLRLTSFHALIASTLPSGSLSPPARADLAGPRARDERSERLARFLATWCTASAGGVEPFFRGLWSAMRAQSRGDERRGGAGGRRVVWEIDDAVFLESGGPEFMHEAVSMLKGVLGFEDQPLTSPPKMRPLRTSPQRQSASRARRPPPPASRTPTATIDEGHGMEELLTLKSRPSGMPPASPPAATAAESRTRATSDPFNDNKRLPGKGAAPQARTASGRGPAPPPPPSRRKVSAAQTADPLRSTLSLDQPSPLYPAEPSSNAASPLLPPQDERESSPVVRALEAAAAEAPGGAGMPRAVSEDRVRLLGRTTSDASDALPVAGLFRAPSASALIDDDDEPDGDETDVAAEEAELNAPRFRLWTLPAHTTDQELDALLGLFPAHIRARAQVRFPFVRPGKGIKDLELGLGDAAGWDTVVVGGGSSDGDGDDGNGAQRAPPTEVLVPKLQGEEACGVVRSGTGRMWVGTEPRAPGWPGGAWFRFKRWWRRLFGMD